MTLGLKYLLPVPLKEKILQRQSAIWNTHLLAGQGEWIKIKAPSGTGKTTLVHCLYKLRHDYEGSIEWDGIPLQEIRDDRLAKLRQQQLSIIFQDMKLFPNLTARENIELNRVLQYPCYESIVIDEMAEKLGIRHILHQRAALCSYGEQQRVAIIRALVQPFQWLIMDEPFSHLDKANTQKAVALITDECRKRKAGLFITDLHEDSHFAYTQEFNL